MMSTLSARVTGLFSGPARRRCVTGVATAVIGFIGQATAQDEPTPENGWGVAYEAFLEQMGLWSQHPAVRLDSIGSSVQGRALWMITVTEGDTTGKARFMVHARTHPVEVQSYHIAKEMIDFLLAEGREELRARHLYHIIPFHNPDGVALGRPRENANGVDLESNWDKAAREPEVESLNALFDRLSSGTEPVRVALNLHSDQNLCSRFFVYHKPSGTSPMYGRLEQDFIARVQGYFEGGIENWDFVQTWTSTATQYPESYWWIERGQSVMALTYEDTNDGDTRCQDATDFDKTARALILGGVDYMAAHSASVQARRAPNLRRNPALIAAPAWENGRSERVGDVLGRGWRPQRNDIPRRQAP